MSPEYHFQDQFLRSAGIVASGQTLELVRRLIPDAISAELAHPTDDKNGTDIWVYRDQRLRPISVDQKTRELDPMVAYGSDDLALETWSNVERRKIGWALDPTKQTDYILWYFVPTRRYVFLPFLPLRTVFAANNLAWRSQYRSARQNTDGLYHSECLFVPQNVLWRAIHGLCNGRV